MEVLQDIVGFKNRKIYHDDKCFSFGLDSLSLIYFVNISDKDKKIIDLGTGNGIIPLILSLNTNISIDAIEIQQELFDLANKSIKYNKINNINLINIDMKEYISNENRCTYDVVISNPPYFENTSRISVSKMRAIARSEITITLEEVVNTAMQLLKDKGRFYIVYRVDRFDELMLHLINKNFGIKRVRFIHNTIDVPAKLVLVEALKCCNSDYFVDKPLFIKDDLGNNTKEYNLMLGVDENDKTSKL